MPRIKKVSQKQIEDQCKKALRIFPPKSRWNQYHNPTYVLLLFKFHQLIRQGTQASKMQNKQYREYISQGKLAHLALQTIVSSMPSDKIGRCHGKCKNTFGKCLKESCGDFGGISFDPNDPTSWSGDPETGSYYDEDCDFGCTIEYDMCMIDCIGSL